MLFLFIFQRLGVRIGFLSSLAALCFQDVVLQWLMTDGVQLNQIDAEDPEVSARADAQSVRFARRASLDEAGSHRCPHQPASVRKPGNSNSNSIQCWRAATQPCLQGYALLSLWRVVWILWVLSHWLTLLVLPYGLWAFTRAATNDYFCHRLIG